MILSFQEGETVLHVAATSGQLETVEALLDRGCDANVQDFVSLLIFLCLLLLTEISPDWPHSPAESGRRRAPGHGGGVGAAGRQPGPPGRAARQHGAARGRLEGLQSDGEQPVPGQGQRLHEEQRRLHCPPPELPVRTQSVLQDPPPTRLPS